MCEGFSLEDVIAMDAAHIERYGYTLIGVADPARGDDDPASWVYTVGLLDRMDHPEFVIAGVPTRTSAPILAALAGDVLDGERFLVGETIDLGDGIARVGAVHDVQYELDTFNMWHNLKHAGALQAPELVAVQIVLPAALCPFRERSWQPRLSDPAARVWH
jgi:hypothetical protein